MADVTVNIRGNASQLRNELDDISRNPSGGGSGVSGGSRVGSSLPDNNRMIEDVRKEMQQRGVLMAPGSNSMTQVINQYGQSQKGVVNEAITERYNVRREDMRRRMGEEYDDIDKRMEERRTSGLANLGDKANDPFYRTILDQQIDQQTELEYKKVGSKYDEEEEQLNIDERSEKNKAEEELTTAIKELTEYFNRQSESGGNSDSYIGRLRAEQQELIRRRDSAETEDDAMSAQRELGEVNDKLRRVLESGNSQQEVGGGMRGLQMGLGATNAIDSLQNGNIGGALMGGAMMTGNPYVIAAAAFLAGGAKIADNISGTYESMSGLAAYRATSGGKIGAAASEALNSYIPNYGLRGYGISQFGMDAEEFSGEASKRIRGRGTSDNWFVETFRQIGLERNLALKEGALMQGGQYDRYGINVTEGLSRLVTILNGIQGSGVSFDDFTRVQEKYDIQQQIMGSYMNRADKPNYDVANANLAAFSSVQGITQDSRIGTDYQSFQGMIQQPMNERMRALIYSSVADLFPETGGRMDLIDRELRNPENEGKIMQSVIQRITQQFGGTDTQMGYFAFKSLLPNIAPDRVDEYINQFSNGGGVPGQMLSSGIDNQSTFNQIGAKNMDIWATQSTEFKTAWTKGVNDIVNTINYWGGRAFGTAAAPNANTLKSGGRK